MFVVDEWFLMHRVELKARIALLGRESYSQFLMHRVELKEISCFTSNASLQKFLMHRVELKVGSTSLTHPRSNVPNAPCGVESMAGFHLLL